MLLEPGHGGDQILERAPQPIEAPDHEGVASAQEFADLVEPGPHGIGAGRGVGDDLLAAGLPQRVALKVEVLVLGGHTRIADPHESPPRVRKTAERGHFLTLFS